MPETQQNFQTIQSQFAQTIRDPDNEKALGDFEPRRLKVYQELFYNNIESFAASSFPVLKEILSEENWHVLVRAFFIQHKCETPYFLEISEEFLAYLQSSMEEGNFDFLPEYAWQLAHWEWMELHADVADAKSSMLISKVSDEQLLTSRLQLSETAWCCAYDYPVHRISEENSAPEPVATYLMVYRNGQDEVGFNELNPLSAALFEAIRQNPDTTAEELLTHLADQAGLDHQMVQQGGIAILSQWQNLCILFAQ